MRAAALLVALAACGHRATCDDLGGPWHVDGARWMIVDHGDTLEAYPTFGDGTSAHPDVVAAPRRVSLTRAADGKIAGELRRRYLKRADGCEARVPARLLGCRAGRELDLEIGQLAEPTSYTPCMFAPSESRVTTHWTRD